MRWKSFARHTVLEAIPAATVDIISKVSASVSPFQSEYCSRRSEQELLNTIRFNSPIALRNQRFLEPSLSNIYKKKILIVAFSSVCLHDTNGSSAKWAKDLVQF